MIIAISFSYSTPMTTSFWFYRKTAVPFAENLRNIFNTWLLKIPLSDIAWSYGPRWCHKRVIRSQLPITWPSQRFPSNRPCWFTVVGLIELCLKGSLKIKISTVNSLSHVLESTFCIRLSWQSTEKLVSLCFHNIGLNRRLRIVQFMLLCK